MRFPAEKNAGCPKAPSDFPPRKKNKKAFTPLPLPQSLYGHTGGRTLTSEPKFLGSISYQVSLPKGAPLRTDVISMQRNPV